MEQGCFPFPVVDEVPDSVVAACRDFKSAIRLCIEVSGLERKEVAFHLGLQDAHLSRMLADSKDEERHFPVNKLNKLMEVCGNIIPLRWMANQRGFGLYRLKSQVEMELDAEKAVSAELRRELELTYKVLKQMRVDQ